MEGMQVLDSALAAVGVHLPRESVTEFFDEVDAGIGEDAGSGPLCPAEASGRRSIVEHLAACLAAILRPRRVRVGVPKSQRTM